MRQTLLLALCLAGCAGGGEVAVESHDEAATVCAAGPTVSGIDVSSYQGTIDWARVAGSGRKFGIAKASEGTGYTDPTFAGNWSGMAKNGMLRGAYHFFRASVDAVAQAQHFVSIVGKLGPNDFTMLDLEVTDGQSAATVASRALTWLKTVEQMTGKMPIVYTGPSFFQSTLGNPAGFVAYPLVIANYGVNCPDVPGSWKTWTMWQYSSTGSVPGIAGNVDEDTFNGDLAALQKLVANGQPADPCAGLTDGKYCGGDGITGDKNTLFTCKGGLVATEEACSGGCKYNPPGTPDACNPPAPAADGGTTPPAAGADGGTTGGPSPEGNGATGSNAGGSAGSASEPATPAGGGCSMSGAPGSSPLALALLLLALAFRRRRARA